MLYSGLRAPLNLVTMLTKDWNRLPLHKMMEPIAKLGRLVPDRWKHGWERREHHAAAAFLVALFAILLTIWRRRRQPCSARTPSAKKSSSSSLLRIARSSSAAGLASLKQVSSSTSFARLSEAVKNLKCFRRGCFVPAISGADSFVPPASLKNMSLRELSRVIEYANELNRRDFDAIAFVAGLPVHAKEVVAAMDAAVTRSRGASGVRLSSASSAGRGGDALYFCAAMRILVEWRAARITPADYKAYAAGMNVARRDFVQNVAKVEEAVHNWIEHQAMSGEENVASPTISQLLHFELVNNVHTRLPKLKDKSAAIGLVWINRQLQFQTEIFCNLQQVPTTYRTAMDAVRAAYKSVFSRYHGWTIQQVFNYSFNGAPPVSVFYRQMNPEVVQNIDSTDGDMVMVDFPPKTVQSSFTSSSYEDDDDDDMVTCTSHDGFNLIKIGQDIQRNWEKLAASVERDWSNFVDNLPGNKEKRRAHRDASPHESRALRRASTADSQSSSSSHREPTAPRQSATVPKFVMDRDALQQYIEQEITVAAHKDIDCYLSIMKPVLKGLMNTIDEYGMNDPSRV